MYALLTYRHHLRHRIPVQAGRDAEGRCAVCLFGGDPMVSYMLDRLTPQHLNGSVRSVRRGRRRVKA